MMDFACEFHVVIIFLINPYLFLRRAAATLAANSLPLSMLTSVSHEYLVNYVCSNTLATSSVCLFWTLAISYHPVAGSIIVRQPV